MKERPILFSAPMVRALLDGSKTQTRRVCKPADGLSYVVAVQDPNERGQRPPYYTPGWFGDEDGEIQFFCPYGQPGDRLWVREAWKAHTTFDNLPPRDIPQTHVWYMADEGYKAESRTRASMHMPRWASRITLEIVGVRVERLLKISEADAKAEGAMLSDGPCTEPEFQSYTLGYLNLWNSINGPDSWNENPWVWVIEFKRVTT